MEQITIDIQLDPMRMELKYRRRMYPDLMLML